MTVAAVVPAVVPLLGMPNKDASPGGGSTAVSAAKRPLYWVLAILAAALLPVVPLLRQLLRGASQRLAGKVPVVVPLVPAVVPLLRQLLRGASQWLAGKVPAVVPPVPAVVPLLYTKLNCLYCFVN